MNFPATLFVYIARQFLVWFAATFMLILALVFLGDFVELIRRASVLPNVTVLLLAHMCFLKVPYNAQEVMPFAVLLGSILALWRMTRSQELVVARAAGVSVWQFLMPAMALAFLIGVVGVTLFNPIASALQATYAQLDGTVLHNQSNALLVTGSGLWLRQADGEGNQAVIHGVEAAQDGLTLKDVSILYFNSQDQVVRRVDAARAELEAGHWHVTDAWNWLPTYSAAKPVSALDLPTTLTRRKIEEGFASPETLSFWSLPGFIQLLEQSGFSAQRHRLYFDSLLARPFLLCAMVLIAAIFSLRMQRRGGTTAMIIGGVASGFMLYFLSDVVFALGDSAIIPVTLAAWTPAGVSMLLGTTFLLHLEDG
jgi:lipopolysaccharide export system permease protein